MQRIAEDGGKHPLCVIQAAGSVALEARCAGVKSKAPGTENIQVNGADDSAVVSSLQAKLSAGQVDRLHRHARRPDRARRAEGDGGRRAARRSSSPSTSTPTRRRPSRTARSSSRSTSSPTSRATMAVTSLYLNLKNGNDIGGGGPVLTGPSFVDKDQHRRHPSVRGEQHPLVAARGGRPLARLAASRSHRNPEVLMSQTSEKPPAVGTPAEASQPGPARARQPAAGTTRDRRPGGGHRDRHLLPDRGAAVPVGRRPWRRCSTRARRSASSPWRRHADDRRRVRPLRRRHGHRGRAGQRDVLLPVRHQPVGRRAARRWSSRWPSASSTAIW